MEIIRVTDIKWMDENDTLPRDLMVEVSDSGEKSYEEQAIRHIEIHYGTLASCRLELVY